jgi:predicted outer membrane protein
VRVAVRAPTDPQIAAIVVTTNQVDIDAGKLAKSGAQSPDVQASAQRMITARCVSVQARPLGTVSG